MSNDLQILQAEAAAAYADMTAARMERASVAYATRDETERLASVAAADAATKTYERAAARLLYAVNVANRGF